MSFGCRLVDEKIGWYVWKNKMVEVHNVLGGYKGWWLLNIKKYWVKQTTNSVAVYGFRYRPKGRPFCDKQLLYEYIAHENQSTTWMFLPLI